LGIDDRRIRVVLIVLASLALADCGGGGGGGGGSTLPANCVAPTPSLSGATVSAALNHGTTVNISGGSAFGVKAPVLPVVLDRASGTNILDKWDGAWPTFAGSGSSHFTTYRSVQRSIPMPHSHVTHYIAGAHFPGNDAESGYNVMFWKNRTITSYPAYTYASWYQRYDDAWVFENTGNVDLDNNLKAFAFSVCCSPYELPNNWYIEYNPRPATTNSIPTWNITDDGTSLQFPDQNGENSFWFNAVNPMAGQWTKIEVEIKYSNQSNGYIRLWENGTQKINYVGRTDSYAGNMRTEGIGGYATSRNTNNWRYFTDVYLDYTPARIVLANSANLSTANIVENQIPTNWSDTSIDFAVNLGKFNSGQTAWLFVVNLCGQPSNSGLQVPIP
jgi:hypothetical protein